jgi:hypothetical protein
MTHHNQTKELTTWFLNLPLDVSIDNKRHKSLKFESKTHDAQLEDQKPTKNSRRSSRRGKNHNTNKRHKKRQTKEKSKENLKIRKLNTPPEINSP